jgi:hypothetical protein
VAEETRDSTVILCPSAQPDWDGSVVLGVIGGSADEPRLTHFASLAAVTSEVLALAAPVTPGEVFRFSAPCLEGRCHHYVNSTCRLAERMTSLLPEVTGRLPACAIRGQCRWWRQEGPAACRRCSQIVTDNYNPSPVMKEVAYGDAKLSPARPEDAFKPLLE